MSFRKKTIRDMDVAGKTVLMRVDYNLPQDENGVVTDDLRIRESLGTIRGLFDAGAAKIVLMAHLGRPDGEWNEKYTLKPVFERLAGLLDGPAVFLAQNIETEGAELRAEVDGVERGSLVLLENIRFYAAEELKGKTEEEAARRREFAEKIVAATGAEVFVMDCFGVAHRNHVSISEMNEILPGAAGLLVEKEVETIEGVMSAPKRPLVAIVGGAKIGDKIEVMKRLVEMAEVVVIGGAMANTFLKYEGKAVGKSLVEEGQDEVIAGILGLADEMERRVILPVDVVVAKEVGAGAEASVKSVDEVAEDDLILDIGFRTREEITEVIAGAGTVVWSGTLGLTEYEQFAGGSEAVIRAVLANNDLETVIGGGDTGGFAEGYRRLHGEEFTGSSLHISTGGGASLEVIEGKKLPGVEALEDR
ncbi:phosphoglycerate kinase [Candidatus Saccharibacteria bacterium]|nr:phosphoglycerate kinase [Candidatus Saccharibacteria bacterium]